MGELRGRHCAPSNPQHFSKAARFGDAFAPLSELGRCPMRGDLASCYRLQPVSPVGDVLDLRVDDQSGEASARSVVHNQASLSAQLSTASEAPGCGHLVAGCRSGRQPKNLRPWSRPVWVAQSRGSERCREVVEWPSRAALCARVAKRREFGIPDRNAGLIWSLRPKELAIPDAVVRLTIRGETSFGARTNPRQIHVRVEAKARP